MVIWNIFLSFYEAIYILHHFFGSLSNLGIKGADDEELKQMASTPYRTHVYNVFNFDLIKDVQKELITNVCSGVDDQLNSLVSGEEGKMQFYDSNVGSGFGMDNVEEIIRDA